ncbi:MAG: hypothetical protein RRY53_03935, partial [Pseudoflavonifractor sp.]
HLSEDWEYAPVQVRNTNGDGYLTGIVDITAGAYESYALTADGKAYIWGGSTTGRTYRYPTPFALPDGSEIAQISAGYDHTLAVTTEGEVWAWGNDKHGQLGFRARNNDTWNPTSSVYTGNYWTPRRVERGGLVNGTLSTVSFRYEGYENNADGISNEGYLTNVMSVYAGKYYSVALMDSGAVYAWGTMDADTLNDDIGDTNLVDTNEEASALYYAAGRNINANSAQRMPVRMREGTEQNLQGNYLRDVLALDASFQTTKNHILLLGAGNVKAVSNTGTLSPTVLNADKAQEYVTDRSATVFGVGASARKQMSPNISGGFTAKPVVVSGLTTDYVYPNPAHVEGDALSPTITVPALLPSANLPGGDRVVQVAVGGTQSGVLLKNGDIHQWGNGAAAFETLKAEDAGNTAVSDKSYLPTGEHRNTADHKVRQT